MTEKDQLLDLAKSLDEVTFNLVTSQVEKLLREAEGGNVEVLEEKKMEDVAKRILLSIWDFAGQSVYYTTHQVTWKKDTEPSLANLWTEGNTLSVKRNLSLLQGDAH